MNTDTKETVSAFQNGLRRRQLHRLIDEESPEYIHNPEVDELLSDGRGAVCGRFAACFSEGSGESSYRDNPDYCVGSAEEVSEYAAGSAGEGWVLNWIVDLDTGEGRDWFYGVTIR